MMMSLTGGATTRHQSTAFLMLVPDHHGRYKHIHHHPTQHDDTPHSTHASKQHKQAVREADATSSSTQHSNTTRPIQVSAGATPVERRYSTVQLANQASMSAQERRTGLMLDVNTRKNGQRCLPRWRWHHSRRSGSGL